MSKTFPKKIGKNFDGRFSSIFVLSRFECFSAMGVQKHYKNVLQKNRVEKFYKTDFFSIYFNRVLGRFSVRGVQKHDKKYRKNKTIPGPFLASDPPTHHGGHRFFLAAPLPNLAFIYSDSDRPPISDIQYPGCMCYVLVPSAWRWLPEKPTPIINARLQKPLKQGSRVWGLGERILGLASVGRGRSISC
jgi:hypothetical protein